MRLFLALLTVWTVLTLVVGIGGRAYVENRWADFVSEGLRRDAVAVQTMVESQVWDNPPESDPDWQRMEQQLQVGAVTVPLPEANFDSEETLPVEWSRLGLKGHRVSLVFPARVQAEEQPKSEQADNETSAATNTASQPPSPSGSGRTTPSDGLRITRDVEASGLGNAWWWNWLLLNILAYSIALVCYVAIRRDANAKRTLLKPWFQALRNNAAVAQEFLPQVEAQDSDLSIHLDSVASSINQVVSNLRNANDRSELVLGNLREGVLAVDDRSRILLANKALRRLLELPDGDYLYRPYLEVIRVPAIAQLIDRVLDEHLPSDTHIEYGSEEKHLRIIARTVPFSNSRVGALLTVRDETLVKRVDMVKRDFVANASHELKTPLAAIRAYAETLQMGALDDKQNASNFVNNIISQADRMDGLVQGMLQLSRVEVGTAISFREFDAVEAIEPCLRATEAIAHGKNVTLNIEEFESPLMIRSDRDGFQTVASNLLSNGVRYTRSGGSVFVQLAIREDRLILQVRDTGIGMSADDLDRVFERFYRAEKDRSADTGGTGLGLSIVKHLTQSLGGTVSATSELGQGSCFIFELPLEPQEEEIAGDASGRGIV